MKWKDFLNLPNWLKQNRFYRGKLSGSSDDSNNSPCVQVHPTDANLISSERISGKHALLLDLDVASYYVNSTHHNHLYIDVHLDLDDLKEVVDVLAKHGIVEQGIKRQLEERGCLTLRPPGVKKDNADDDASIEEYKELVANPKLKFDNIQFNLETKYDKINTFPNPYKYVAPQKPVYYTENVIDTDTPIYSEKYQFTMNAEFLSEWTNNIGYGFMNPYKPLVFRYHDYKKDAVVYELIDYGNDGQKRVLATGTYVPMHDYVVWTFDKKKWPFDWNKLVNFLEGGGV